MNTRPRIFFLHMPRTGGQTLIYDILFRNFRPKEIAWVNASPGKWFSRVHKNITSRVYSCLPGKMRELILLQTRRHWYGNTEQLLTLPPKRRNAFSVLVGHMPFGLAEYFDGPSVYITLLRNPVMRTVSDYYYCRADRKNPAHQIFMETSLAEFVRQGFSQAQNCYTRYISNAVFGQNYASDQEMYEEARKRLLQFAFVGIMEHYEDSMDRLCNRFGLFRYPVSIHNSFTPKDKEISEEETDIIRHYNSLDVRLYEELVMRFLK